MISDEDADRLLRAIETYDRDSAYDEVFTEVHTRIAKAGSAGKIDVAALAVWKRSAHGAWTADLMSKPESHVRAATEAAFAAADDRTALRALAAVPGYKAQGPLATALLTAYDPNKYAVMDVRALLALDRLGTPVNEGLGITLRYLATVRALTDFLRPRRGDLSPREVDKGLYILGERPRRPTRRSAAAAGQIGQG